MCNHRDNWNCLDCGDCTYCSDEYYMVQPRMWRCLVCENGMLCIGCLETRLGRKLNHKDFINAPINDESCETHSERLQDRLKGWVFDKVENDLFWKRLASRGCEPR